jgi:perosamine synthetase
MKALSEIAEDHNLLIINDCAQAHGTEYDGKDLGAWPNLSCYSFYPTKTMTTGEGGIVTTDDPELYRLGCLLRSHGDDGRYHHVLFGLNYRITDIMSAIGLNQLAQLDEFLAKRKYSADVLLKGLEKIDGIIPQKITPMTKPSYSYFSAILDLEKLHCTRDEFLKALSAENIDCGVHYPAALTEQPIVKEMLKPKPCPVSEDLAKRIVSLPMHPYLSDDDLNMVIAGVEKVANYYLA